MSRAFSLPLALALLLLLTTSVGGQETPAATATQDPPETPTAGGLAEKWDRLIYVPFKELTKVFDNQNASVVLPYAEYMDLLKKALEAQSKVTASQDVVLSSSTWTASVEKDLARITVELKMNVLKADGWASLPLTFGTAAIGKVEPDDGSVLLKGTGQGQYELLIKGAGTEGREASAAGDGEYISGRPIIRDSVSANRYLGIDRDDSRARPDRAYHAIAGAVADRRSGR